MSSFEVIITLYLFLFLSPINSTESVEFEFCFCNLLKNGSETETKNKKHVLLISTYVIHEGTWIQIPDPIYSARQLIYSTILSGGFDFFNYVSVTDF